MTKSNGPTIQTFLKAVKWPISNFVLAKAGISRHQIEFHTPKSGGHVIAMGGHSNFPDYGLVYRSLLFSHIGILCCSNTDPCVKEILLNMRLPKGSPIWIRNDSPNTIGFGSDDGFGNSRYGESQEFRVRVDYTESGNTEVEEAAILKLEMGKIFYPFRLIGTVLEHKTLAERKSFELSGKSLKIWNDKERKEIESSYTQIDKELNLDIGLLLDNDDLLVFHWNSNSEKFEDDFYNAGISSSAKQ
ncbi:MAG: hypothetical protein DHS20C09_07630 [marine bacterium B5-7]|nr:MAG: hypothetical protein DHS20C09_07630 [marine bacterium B5-7]